MAISLEYQLENISAVCAVRKPLLVVSCNTFNHINYLRDALDGFIMQRTNFPFVAVVHDDASTDGTAYILREYAERYPDIILPIYESENQYSKRDGSLRRIKQRALAATGARYVALCEGDDYWTDPTKLQRQVDFLEAHPDYSLCFHNAVVHYEDNRMEDHIFADLQTREYNEKEIADGWLTATATFTFRTSIYESNYYKAYQQSRKFIVGDYPLMMTLLREGKIYAFEDAYSVYRINRNGWTQQKQSPVKKIIQEIEVKRIFGGYAGNVAARQNVAIVSREALALLAKGEIRTALKIWRLAFGFAPIRTVKENIKFVFKMLDRRLKQ